jgi:hypothetical protein
VQQNFQRLSISSHDNEVGNASVEGLGGLVSALLQLLVVGRLLNQIENSDGEVTVSEGVSLGVNFRHVLWLTIKLNARKSAKPHSLELDHGPRIYSDHQLIKGQQTHPQSHTHSLTHSRILSGFQPLPIIGSARRNPPVGNNWVPQNETALRSHQNSKNKRVSAQVCGVSTICLTCYCYWTLSYSYHIG